MFDNLFYTYSAVLGFILGASLIFIGMAISKPLLITHIVYDRAEECIKQGGEYVLFYEKDWVNESCKIETDLYKD